MPVFSRITVEFLIDFDEDYQCTFFIDDNGTPDNQQYTWVTTRGAAFEVTTGTPTATAGETTAINLEAAFDLDNPTGYVTTQTTNTLVIESETVGEEFWGFKATDENDVLLVNGLDYNVTFENYEPPFKPVDAESILTRSPHYVFTPFRFPTTTAVDIDVYVWSGDFANIPASPQVSINRLRPTVDFEDLNTNIADIVDAYVEGSPQINTTSTSQIFKNDGEEVKWVRYIARYTDSTQDVTPVAGNFASTNGYGYFLQGVNPQLPKRYLTSASSRKVDRNGYILLPYINDTTYTQIEVNTLPTSEYTQTHALLTTDLTEDYIQYLSIDVSDLVTDTQIQVTFTKLAGVTDVVTYNIVDECRDTPKTFIFKNKEGVYDVITLFKKNRESLIIDKSQFVNNYVTAGTYDTTKHQYKDINIIAKESLICNSGLLNESQNELFKELLQSDTVYLLDGTTVIPMQVKTSSLEYKTRVNDGVRVEYRIEFDYAFSKINNI